MIQALQRVFQKPQYTLLALITSGVVFAFAVWLPNLSLIVRIMGHQKSHKLLTRFCKIN